MGNVPKLRFPQFSGEWEEKKLEILCTKISDGIHSTPIYEKYGEYYFINGNNLKSGIIILDEKTKKVSKEEYLKHFRELNKNTILMSINGTIGNLAFYNDEKVMLGKSASYINIDSSKTNKYFISNQLLSSKIQYFYTSELTGSTIKNLSLKTIKNTPIILSSKQEQEKIASFLSSVDKKIEKLEEKIALQEKYKKAMMQKLFSQETRFKADNGSDFPDWEEKKLGEISTLTSSKRIYLSDYTNFGIPFYRGKEISELKLGKVPKDILYISEKVYLEYKLNFGVPQTGDLLITAVGTLGNVLRIEDESPFYFKDGNLIWIKDICEDSNFLKVLLEWYKNDICKTSIGSTQRALTMVELRKIKFFFPSNQEQQKIANFLSSLDKKIEATKKQKQKAQEFKKGLLQQMFV